jgi:hypothetical protein
MRKISQVYQVAIASAICVLILMIAVGGSYVLGLHALSQSQHKWCTTLELLTQGPQPSTQQGKTFRIHLKELEHNFGC